MIKEKHVLICIYKEQQLARKDKTDNQAKCNGRRSNRDV